MKNLTLRLLILIWLSVISSQAWCGTWTANGFIYKPSLGARGATEKNAFDSGQDRLDARLGKEIWVGDPNYGTTLSDAITAIGSNPVTLRVPAGTYAITSNLTIPANICLREERGAVFSIGDGVTLTINGPIQAGLYQVFSCTGTGKAVFGTGAVKEVYSEWFGAKGDGVTDDAAAIQAALNACQASGANLLLVDKTYKINSGLIYCDTAHSIIGNNASIDASAVVGYAITVHGVRDEADGWVKLYSQRNKYIQGINLYGSKTSGNNGIYLGDAPPGTTYGAAHLTLKNCALHNFDIALGFGNNSYCQTFDKLNIYYCNTCVYYPSGLNNSGERITFSNCDFFNSTQLINVSAAKFVFVSCSYTYFNTYAISAALGAQVIVYGGHFESNTDNDYWIKSSDSDTSISLDGYTIWVGGTHSNHEIFYTTNYASINLSNGWIYGPTNPFGYTLQSYSHGSNIDWRTESQWDYVHMKAYSGSNLLVDGGFEDATYNTWQRADWKVRRFNDGSAAGVSGVSLDNTTFASGSYSLKINPAANKSSYLVKQFPVGPNAHIYVSYKIKNSINNANDTLTIKVSYYNAAGDQVNTAAPTNWITYNQTNQFADFTQQTLSAFVPAVAGTAYCKIEIYTNTASDGTSTSWLDDMILNVTQATPPPTNVIPASLYQNSQFTPVVVGSTTAGMATYTFQYGKYQVIGNVCHFWIYLNWTGHTGTGSLEITGLPFMSAWNLQQPMVMRLTGVPFTGPFIYAFLDGSSTILQVRQTTAAGADSGVPISASGNLAISGQYVMGP